MRSFFSVVGVRADGRHVGAGFTNGVGGTRGADVAAGSLRFCSSCNELHEQLLPALDGCVIGVRWPVLSEKLKEDLMLVAVRGVETAGDRALRKSVYAVGGVMGVFMLSSSCLIAPPRADRGLLGSSEGSRGLSVTGVFRIGKAALVREAAVAMATVDIMWPWMRKVSEVK